jgi:hypothetical protein
MNKESKTAEETLIAAFGCAKKYDLMTEHFIGLTVINTVLKAMDTHASQQCSSLKEENERLKADIKTIGQILKDGGWIDLFEKIIALNPTPKTEGTSI